MEAEVFKHVYALLYQAPQRCHGPLILFRNGNEKLRSRLMNDQLCQDLNGFVHQNLLFMWVPRRRVSLLDD